ncbi:type II toxin-antitoxin system HicA family toxin [Desulfosporosinus sp.]|uniref:type II toxin-antitoxin system HicA family toxin n=1 Tax=Desulfosporosinus sp. TaxID=157907 RepID=UPI0034225C12
MQMKRRDLVKKLESAGWYLKRHGDEHDIYKHDNPVETKNSVQVPRHREINEVTAKQILKDAGLK